MEIKWTDTDPVTGKRRFVRAERFGRSWRFTYRSERRGVWEPGPLPTRATWEHVLDALERRYRRRAGVAAADVVEVQRILAKMQGPSTEEE
jgi:hypothetical protein